MVDASAQLADQLLHSCPQLKIIVSSRETLGIPGEAIFRVPSLSLPDQSPSAESLIACEAARLFIERATKTEPRFQLTDHNAISIAQICRRCEMDKGSCSCPFRSGDCGGADIYRTRYHPEDG